MSERVPENQTSENKNESTAIADTEVNFVADYFDEVYGDKRTIHDTITDKHTAVGRSTHNTQLMLERMATAREYTPPRGRDHQAPYGRFRGRQILGRGVPIDGGVYLGRVAREALVVDSSSPAMKEVYKKFCDARMDRVLHIWGNAYPDRTMTPERVYEAFNENVVQDIFNFIRAELPYDEKIERVVAHTLHIAEHPDEEVPVDAYLTFGGGVCRHQVLFGGVILERLIREGRLRGRVSLERNYIPNVISHAWIDFTDGAGVQWIIDPAQNIFIKKSELPSYAKFVYGVEDVAAV